MTHAEMDELYELYVLGALDIEEASEIDGHVGAHCEHCLRAIHQAVDTTAGLPYLADPVTPPEEVRKRILASIQPQRSRRRGLWLALPVLAAACIALLAFTLWSLGANQRIEKRLSDTAHERDRLRTAVAILSRPQTRTIQFGASDQAHGRVLIGPDGGVVVIGSEMPEIASNQAFELWLIPTEGNPIPAGVFNSDRSGQFVHVAPQQVRKAQIAAVAVTVEPKAGSPAPTSKPFLVIKLG